MNLYEALEQRRRTIFFLLVLIAVSILAVSSLRDPFALDSFWHLKTAQDWLEKGLSPFIDHYSITHYGERIAAQPIAFQVLLYGFVQLLGLGAGFKGIVFFSGLLTILITLWWLKEIKASTLVVCFTIPILVLLLQQRAMVRPELFSFAFMGLSFVLCEKARNGNATKVFPYIVLTLLVWTNYHSSIMGYVIFFGLFLELALQLFRERASKRDWLIWLTWGLLVFLIGFVNRNFGHPALGFLLLNEWGDLIGEYKHSLKGDVSLVALVLIPFSIITLVLLARKKLYGYMVVCAVFTWAAITMVRMITPGGIAILYLFSLSLNHFDAAKILDGGTRAFRAFKRSVIFATISATVILSVITARDLVMSNRFLLGNFPDELVQYMLDNDKTGKIFNQFEIGGYLIYYLGDTNRVYLDGRTNILYPVDHYLRWVEAMQSPEDLKSELERYDIDHVVLNHQQNLIDLVDHTGLVKLDYADLRYSLYTRNDANFPLAGQIRAKPWCWTETIGEKLYPERLKATEILPPYSPLVGLLDLANDFLEAGNREEYLSRIRSDQQFNWYEESIRFAGYRALELELYPIAFDLFISVRDKVLKDYLAGALASLRINEFDRAEQILSTAIGHNWNIVETNDFRILQALLTELTAIRPLKFIDESYIHEISNSLVNRKIELMQSPVSSRDFCVGQL